MGGDVTRVRFACTTLCRVAPTLMLATFLDRTLRSWPWCSRSSLTSPMLPLCLPLHRLSCFGHCLIRVLRLACSLHRDVRLPAPAETGLLWALSDVGVKAGILVALLPWSGLGALWTDLRGFPVLLQSAPVIVPATPVQVPVPPGPSWSTGAQPCPVGPAQSA